MSKVNMEALQARLDVMALALAALARAVPAEQVAAVQNGLRLAVAQRLDGLALSPKADAAVAADLASLVGDNYLDRRRIDSSELLPVLTCCLT